MLKAGKYITAKGSTMAISGEFGGKSKVSFDWYEEDACDECIPELYDVDGYLVWHCDVCDGGQAKLMPTCIKCNDMGIDKTEQTEMGLTGMACACSFGEAKMRQFCKNEQK